MAFKMSSEIPTVSLDITRRRSEYIANKQAEDENAEEEQKKLELSKVLTVLVLWINLNCVGVVG